MITNEILFGTQIAAIIGYVFALFVLYRVLVAQKDATIQVLEQKIALLETRLKDAENQSPEAVAISLNNRVKVKEEELKRLLEDKSTTQDQIKAKEVELSRTRNDVTQLKTKVEQANKLLSKLLCPECHAPLAQRIYYSDIVEDPTSGREIDVEREQTVFECGRTTIDGIIEHPCGQNVARERSIVLTGTSN